MSMDSEPVPTLATLLETDPTLTWDAFKARLGAIATREELQIIGSDAEEEILLAVADTATFGTAPFRKEDWKEFIGSDYESDKTPSDQALEAIFAIAQRAGVVAAAEATASSDALTNYVIPSATIERRLNEFLEALP
jgi:hypothetical protein